MNDTRLRCDETGAAAVEMAFALPVLIVMLWILVQFAQIYQALAGIQQALGEGARYATICVSVSSSGCTSPTAAEIKAKIAASVYGTGAGTFTISDPAGGTFGTSKYYDLVVRYSQPTNMIFFQGPTVTLARSKRVWIAGG